MTTNNITWSNKQGNRDRKAWLLLVKEEQIFTFNGEHIEGVAVISGSDYRKDGKWSHTTYRLELAPGVVHIAGMNGWETGSFVEGLRSAVSFGRPIDTWEDVASALGVSVVSAMMFLHMWRPKAATALDEVDAKLTALDEVAAKADAETKTVVVSFGAPNNRSYADGFWQSPKGITGFWQDGATIQLIDPTKGWEMGNIAVVGITGTVVSAVRTSGRNGGYAAVTVAIVPGTTTPAPATRDDIPDARELEARLSGTGNEPAPTPPPAPATTSASMADLMAKFGKGR